MQYYTTSHSVYYTKYHVVWVTKYRRKILNPGMCNYLRKVTGKRTLFGRQVTLSVA
ncbi:transposase [Vibrio chagasii]|uniref:transposase n=1 Tax=Vibrio chagasii TaxID=170679 RepID=UPI00373586BD